MKQEKINLLGIFISLVSLGISITTYNVAKEANKISLDANKISNKANDFAKDTLKNFYSDSAFEKHITSDQLADQSFDSIYENEERSKIIDLIRRNDDISNLKSLGETIDIFENIGSKYCKGLIYKQNVREKFSTSLMDICNNDQVFERFKGRKNGTALLCHEFSNNSKFASTFKIDTLKTCHIVNN